MHNFFFNAGCFLGGWILFDLIALAVVGAEYWEKFKCKLVAGVVAAVIYGALISIFSH